MGINPSKPIEHVFYGETPIQFSHNLVSTLSSSPESNTTRAAAADLAIQKLVQAELERLQNREDEVLEALSKEDLSSPTSSTQQEPSSEGGDGGGITSLIPALPGFSSGPTDDELEILKLSRASLQKRVDELRARLGTHIESRDMEPEDVKSARGELVACLRFNDRRPLECWREIERFRLQARKMERAFVSQVVGRE